MTQRLTSLIETGSYSSKDDLKNVIQRLKSKITWIKKAIKKNASPYDDALWDDLYKAQIYLEEFKKLREEL